MLIVNQSNWNIVQPSKPLTFSTSTELVRHLVNEEGDWPQIQMAIDARIRADPVAGAWKKARTYLKDLKHFPRYRKSQFDLYHSAARACLSGNETLKQKDLVSGLEVEIDASRIVISPGQILFHGRADSNLTDLDPYPSFISTSLNPVVACNSALRRAGLNQKNGKPTVYILTMNCSLPALWGQTGNSSEYELLLPPRLTSVVKNEYSGPKYNVIEAEINYRG